MSSLVFRLEMCLYILYLKFLFMYLLVYILTYPYLSGTLIQEDRRPPYAAEVAVLLVLFSWMAVGVRPRPTDVM